MNLDISTKYNNELEELLLKARDNLNNSSFFLDLENYNLLDNYITELNTYYYKSFHEYFFPEYKKSIMTEIEDLLQIKQDQDMIRQDLQANIKRYAKLYNQVKVINNLLKDTREDFNNLLFTVYREKEQQKNELLHALKSLDYTIDKLQNYILILTPLNEDKLLLEAIKYYPDMPRVLVNTFKKSWSELDIIKRLIIRLKTILSLVKQLQSKDISKKIVEGILADLKTQINYIFHDKAWTSLPKPFIVDFNFKVQTFIDLISAYNELNKLDKIRQTAKDYEKLVYNFIIVLDKGIDFLEKHPSTIAKDLLENSFAIINLSQNSLLRLKQNVAQAKGKLDIFQNDILKTGEPDFAYLAKTITTFINDYQDLFSKFLEHDELMQITPLARQLNLVSLQFLELGRYLYSLQEKHGFSTEIEKKYLHLINILDVYLSYTSNTRGDLERIMAPRNLSRVWKSFNVKVERISLEVGKKFPSEYEDILSNANIKRKISPYDINTILYEEGDMFIITVDNMVVYEIPPLTLAEKG